LNEVSLRFLIGRCGIDLDKYYSLHINPGNRADIVVGQVRAVELRRLLHPGIAQAARVIEMDVGVNDRKVRQT